MYPPTAGAYDTTYNGRTDAFVTKLDPAGDRDAVKWVISGMVGRAFENEHARALFASRQRRTQGGIAAADHHHIIGLIAHESSMPPARAGFVHCLKFAIAGSCGRVLVSPRRRPCVTSTCESM